MARSNVRSEEIRDLPGLCSDCLMLILQLRLVKSIDDADGLRSRIKDLLSRLDARGRDAGFELEQIQDAKFALVAFIDEAITGLTFNQKDSWLANPLQMELFNRYDAGEEFFNRLTQLRQRAQANIQVIEVYYLCMVLGFKGKYQYHDLESLRGVIEDTKGDLFRTKDAKHSAALAPHGKPQEGILDVVSKEVPVWVIGVAAAAAGFLFFVVMTLIINSSADDVVTTIMHAVR